MKFMDTELKINGMHCDACKTLIKMEIDELNLSDKIMKISVDDQKNQGTVELSDVREENIKKIIKAIDSLGQYQVIK